MKYLKTAIFLLLLSAATTYGQENQDPLEFEAPSPIGGYRALQDTIQYPMICWKAELESAFKANIQIDSIGTILAIDFKPLSGTSLTKLDSIFCQSVRSKIQSLKWTPANINVRNISSWISLPFIFVLTDNLDDMRRRQRHNMPLTFEELPMVIKHPKPWHAW